MVAHIIGNSDSGTPQCTFDSQSEQSVADSSVQNCCLIPGLPDDMATLCLARVPSWHHSHTKLVSKIWNRFFHSNDLLTVRRACSVTDDWLYVFSSDPSVTPAEAYNPVTKKWRKLSLMPTDPFTYGLTNFMCVVIENEILIIGGVLFDTRSYPSDVPVASKRVYKYDALRNTWKRMADMNEARGSFACGLIGPKKVMVSGGSSRHAQFSGGGDRLDSAEIYDLGTNTWEKVASMNRVRANCVGFVVGENSEVNFLVIGGYGESRTIDGIVTIDVYYRDVESFSLSTGKWTNLGNMWHHLENWRLGLGVVAYLENKLYTLRGSILLYYDSGSNTWRQETNLGRAENMPTFFGLEGELYIVSMETFQSFRPYPTPVQTYNPSTKCWKRLRLEGFASRCNSSTFYPWKTAIVRF